MPTFLQSPLTWHAPKSFTDWVKKTRIWRLFYPEQTEMDLAKKAAQKWDAARIATEIKQYLFDEEIRPNAFLQLDSLGKKTHPAIIRFLRDPELYSLWVKPKENLSVRRCPFDDALDLLGPKPGPEWVEALAPFLNNSDQGVREGAIWAMALTGASTIIPHIRKAFNDDYLRPRALVGLECSLERLNASLEVSESLFSDVRGLLRAGKNLPNASRTLFLLNGPKARDYFLSEEVFTPESPVLPYALGVLADHEILVPRDPLGLLIKEMDTPNSRHSQAPALGQALRLLGRHQKEEDRGLLRSHSENPDENIAYGASMGLLASLNLEGFLDKIQDNERKHGYETLPEKQRLYLATYYCDLLSFTGFYTYFNTSLSDAWPDALAGFKAMGCTELARNFEEAIAKFGSNGPSTNLHTRQEQLAGLINNNFCFFEDQERPFHERRGTYLMCASRFVVRNAEAFSS